MYGNAPKAYWSRMSPPDEENRIALACRALLLEIGDRRILLEAGIGAFFPPKLRARYGVLEEEHVLLRSLAKLGLGDEDITDIVLSHLHFDHAGGLLAAHAPGEALRLLFPRARFFVSSDAWARAQHPHLRDRASFVRELPELLSASKRLHIVSGERHPLLPQMHFHLSDGHTPGLLLTEIRTDDPRRAVVFGSDLVPGTSWVHLPMTMGYDRFPELLVDEKARLLQDLAARGAWLFYTHDPEVVMSRISQDLNGKLSAIDCQAEVLRLPL